MQQSVLKTDVAAVNLVIIQHRARLHGRRTIRLLVVVGLTQIRDDSARQGGIHLETGICEDSCDADIKGLVREV